MTLKMYQVDAFTDRLFSGNPAAVCLTDRWLSDHLMQQIAMENNLAETAFVVPNGDHFEIRWFTPAVEVDLCGHATLGAAFILYNEENYDDEVVKFVSPRSGPLTVSKEGELLTLDFPADIFSKTALDTEITGCFNIAPIEAYRGKTDYLLVFGNEEEIRNIEPDFVQIGKLKARGVIITARGEKVDFVSRFFAPQSGIDEDPVTGSAHTTLIPYWYERTGKIQMTAKQLSSRQGELICTYRKDRVGISGQARLYMRGEIEIS